MKACRDIVWTITMISTFFTGHSQGTVLIEGASGTAYVYRKISPDEARTEAIDEAKLNALKKAGITENIQSHQVLLSSQGNTAFTQMFTSNIMSEMRGAVQSFTIVSEEMSCVDKKQAAYKVVLNAVVRKYSSVPDPAFQLTVEGLNGSYRAGDKMSFTLKASRDGYLTIFNITEHDTTVLFPLKGDNNRIIAEKLYVLPDSRVMDYVLETSKASENNQLLFVLTKENCAYNKCRAENGTSFEDIRSWLYSIEPASRVVSFYSFVITQ